MPRNNIFHKKCGGQMVATGQMVRYSTNVSGDSADQYTCNKCGKTAWYDKHSYRWMVMGASEYEDRSMK